MSTQIVRRLYVYVAAFIGLQMLSIGITDLIVVALEKLSGTVAIGDTGISALRLGGSIALVLVGLPLWLGHWMLAQRDTRHDDDRQSALRRLYAYAVLLVAAINVLTGMQSTLSVAFNALARSGPASDWLNPFVGAIVAAIVWAGHWRIFAADRDQVETAGANATLRRWYLSLIRWVSLTMTAVSAGFLIHGLAQRLIFNNVTSRVEITEPTAGLISGMIIWMLHELWARRLVAEPGPLQSAELQSALRQVYTALVLTAGLVAFLTGLTALLAAGLRAGLGVVTWNAAFADETRAAAAVIVALPIMFYHGAQLLTTAQISGVNERVKTAQRVILYLMAAVSLVALYIGLSGTIGMFLRLRLQVGIIGDTWQTALSWYAATAIVALPVYVTVFRRSELMVGSSDEEERMISRRIYLYAGLLFGIIGAAITSTRLIQLIIVAVLGEGERGVAATIGQIASYAVLSIIIAVLYSILLRRAGAVHGNAGAGRTVALVVDEPLQHPLIDAITHELPGITVIACASGDTAERRVILAGSDVLVMSPAGLRDSALDAFRGPRLLVMTPPAGITLVGPRREGTALLREAARKVRRICLSEVPPPAQPVATTLAAGPI